MATKALSFISSDNHYRYLLHDTAIYPQNKPNLVLNATTTGQENIVKSWNMSNMFT